MVPNLFNASIYQHVAIERCLGQSDLLRMPFWPAERVKFFVDGIEKVVDALEFRRVRCILAVR